MPFNLDSGLYATLTMQGQVKCFNTYSATEMKIVAQATSQPAGVNYDVYVYYYNDVTKKTEFKSTSQELGNVNEFSAAKMPAGNYLIYIKAQTGSSPLQFIVGAAAYPAFDAYEANDTPSTATPASINQVFQGNSDYAGDIDYFVYTTESDQEEFQPKIFSSNHKLQIYNGTNWVFINSNNINVLPNTQYYLRVVYSANVLDVSVKYILLLANPIKYMRDDTTVTNDENLPNLGWGLEVFSRITFKGHVEDFKHRLLPYGIASLKFSGFNGNVHYDFQTGLDGYVDYTMNFVPCEVGGPYGRWGDGIDHSFVPSFQYQGMSGTYELFQYCKGII
jgi:hypothetical protein